jgi:hypothetical protein
MKTPFNSLWCAAALSALLAGVACGQSGKPDTNGYIRDWLMLAPVSIGEENLGTDFIDKDQIEKESTLKPKAGDKLKVKDKEFAWKSVKGKEAVIDLNAELGAPHENAAGYLVAYVVCDNDIADLNMLVGCNDQGRIYLNGKEVFIHTEPGPLEQDAHKVEKLTLVKGVNVIVFKIINDTNNWQGCLRFTDKSNKPVTGFTVKLTP